MTASGKSGNRTAPKTFAELTALIEASRDDLTPSQARLATLVLDGPQEIALTAAAELAKRAGVDESTVVRFAKAIGLSGYPALREVCAAELQRQAGLLARYDSMRREAFGDEHLLDSTANIDRTNIDRTVANVDPANWERIVELVAASDHVHVMGMRACFSAAHLVSYQLSLIRDRVRLVTSLDGTIPEQLAHVTERDAFIAVSLAPYTAQTVTAADYAASRGCHSIAFTDHRSSPLAAPGRLAVLVATDGPLLMPSMTAMTHVLQTLIAAVSKSLNVTGAREFAHINSALAAFNTHVPDGSGNASRREGRK